MIDFVHLNWKSFKTHPPKKWGPYLCLVFTHDVVPEGRAEVLTLFMEEFDGKIYIEDEDEQIYPPEIVIAWTDITQFSFDCNPEKLHTCNNKECAFSKDCSICTLTTKLEDAKWADWFL